MAKFKLLKPRVKNMAGRIRVLDLDEDVLIDPALAERKGYYKSQRWLNLRRDMMDRKCWCGCGRYAVVLDHLVGHEDRQAISVATMLRIPILPTWQDRFWKGPFVSLCSECHNRKTWFEAKGKLPDWIINRAARLPNTRTPEE